MIFIYIKSYIIINMNTLILFKNIDENHIYNNKCSKCNIIIKDNEERDFNYTCGKRVINHLKCPKITFKDIFNVKLK